ncbi:CBS domain-containing protein [Marinactinospora rubrisoli]|uniref:CBS domain-containing protein n=1 Tax=Marinactinospora rubrisoli TaxID=2715399 RepID=A0ABW2KIP2_9ACTN
MTSSIPVAWLVRGGRDGERENAAIAEGLMIAGWDEVGDLSACTTREALRSELRRTYPDFGKALIANWTGQLWRFRSVIAVGDLIVLPMKTRHAMVAIGRVTGDYVFRAGAPVGFRHVRSVEWLRTDVPRDAIKQDLLHSMGSLLTVCGLTRFDAARRIAHLAAHGTDPGNGDTTATEYSAASSAELLQEAVNRAPDNPVRLTIRAFLEHWGTIRRTAPAVERINKDLEDEGLATRPPFTEGWIDNIIELVQVGAEPTAGRPMTTSPVIEDVDDGLEREAVTPRLGDLESANRPVTSVTPQTPISKAMTIMLARNFSQLAVIAEDGTYHGAVSWESIGRARIADPSAQLAQATVAAPLVEYDELLLNQIEPIYTKGFVFVRSPDKSGVTGIVTAADLTRRFGDLARPFVLIEEIERRLRHRVNEVIPLPVIQSYARRKKEHVRSADSLTLGNYRFLLGDAANWALMCWNLDHDLFLELLGAVISIRNETMHFSSDPMPPEDLEKLESFLTLLRTVDPTH